MDGGRRKVILMGEAGVGKTSLVARLIDGTFSIDYKATVGSPLHSNFAVMNGKGEMIDLAIWDTAGTEKYKSISNMFIREANAAVIVFDATRPDPKELLLSYVRQYMNEEPNGFFVIAGNKSDLVRDLAGARELCHTIEDDVREELSRVAALNAGVVEDVNVEVVLVSALSGEGVSEMFMQVADGVSSQKTHRSTLIAAETQGKGCC